ncbi:hypothetical protein IWZ03DRAFT_420358 [Phyllosticta citriasiana]|uniref:B30.2/SPRY domain-containing protein n=1 Tax=Phyllosticta citriasiana TaxID=595635 RepID=A0ABR1L1N1_9PEZI
MPGWTSTYQSWGYHGNDGHKYGNNFRVEDGHLHGSGDTVGAGVDFTKREVFFTKNGIRLGTSFSGETIKGKLSPMIGCGVRGIKIRTNFWVQDLKYPFDADMALARGHLGCKCMKHSETGIDIDDPTMKVCTSLTYAENAHLTDPMPSWVYTVVFCIPNNSNENPIGWSLFKGLRAVANPTNYEENICCYTINEQTGEQLWWKKCFEGKTAGDRRWAGAETPLRPVEEVDVE